MKSNAMKNLPWEEAILAVLKNASGAMHYTEIAEQISAQKLRKVGANPASCVGAVLAKSLSEETSPFQKVAKGQYALKATLLADSERSVDATEHEAEIFETGALKAFGMFWQRNLVNWEDKPRILGRQGAGASHVNFSEQVGVYLLHDRERVIYVGRADDTLLTRMKSHTTDRLSGRWDRFSWFGLRSVKEDGSLSEPSTEWTHKVVIETLEALLIESLEPPLNRKRGDNFSAAEYLQVADPEIERQKKKAMLVKMLNSDE